MFSEETIARFWSNVEIKGTDECWEWQGKKDLSGYGLFYFAGKKLRAHRYSWELKNGKMSPRLCGCHTCDNPSCVNPNHIFMGSTTINNWDRAKKGRTPKGVKHHKSKLTEQDVIDIRRSVREGVTRRELATKYDLDYGTITEIIYYRTWKHVA